MTTRRGFILGLPVLVAACAETPKPKRTPMMIEIQPPHRLEGHYHSLPKLFLAGSIEMNVAERWQDRLIHDLSDQSVAIFNPRRDDWDSTIQQSITDPRFKEQVDWELDSIAYSDIVCFYFDPATKSPITLLELGKVSAVSETSCHYQKAIVCCPQGFWRRGNIEVVCARSNITLVDNYEDFKTTLRRWIELANLPSGQHRSGA